MSATGIQCKISVLYCVVLLILMVCTCEISVAQKFSLGVKVGALANWAHFGEKEDRAKFGSRLTMGYQGGVLINFPLERNFSFQMEGGYSKRGRKIKFNDNTWTNTASYNMIDLSMSLRKSFTFYLKENLPVDWFVNVGPEINYILNGHGNIQVGGPKYKYEIRFQNDTIPGYKYMSYFHANRWLFGAGIGVGFRFPITENQHIITELRFISGHTYLGKKGTGLPSTNPDQGYSYIGILTYEDTLKTNIKSISISIAYVFDFDIQKGRMGKSTMDKVIKRKR